MGGEGGGGGVQIALNRWKAKAGMKIPFKNKIENGLRKPLLRYALICEKQLRMCRQNICVTHSEFGHIIPRPSDTWYSFPVLPDNFLVFRLHRAVRRTRCLLVFLLSLSFFLAAQDCIRISKWTLGCLLLFSFAAGCVEAMLVANHYTTRYLYNHVVVVWQCWLAIFRSVCECDWEWLRRLMKFYWMLLVKVALPRRTRTKQRFVMLECVLLTPRHLHHLHLSNWVNNHFSRASCRENIRVRQ